MKNKKLKLGSYYFVISAIVISVVIIFNVALSFLPSRYRVFETDGFDIYEISDNTKDLLASVDEEIMICLIAEESGRDEKLSEFIDRYSQLNSNIVYKVIDPIVYPHIKTLCGETVDISKLAENSVLVSSIVRNKAVSYDEIYRVEYSQQDMAYYSMGYTPDGTVYFYGEDKISGAIDYVLADSLPVLYVTEGHNEAELGDDLSNYIENNNYTVSALDMLRISSIPSDASCVFMNCPASDISTSELDMLTAYINKGGRLILVTDYLSYDGDFTNLKNLTKAYSMTAVDGRVVETDTEYYNRDEGFLIPKLSASDSITMYYSESGAALYNATGFTISGDVTALITTSNDAYTVSALDTESGEENRLYSGQCVLGAIASVDTEDPKLKGSFVWYSSPSMTNDDVIKTGGAASEITKMTLQTLCEKDTEFYVSGVPVSTGKLMLNENDISFWTTFLTLLIPLGVILTGIAVRYTRRSR